jgi:hypothetical protein
MTTPEMGVNTDSGLSDDAATEAFLARWTDAAKPSDTNEEEPQANAADGSDEDEATMLSLAADEDSDEDGSSQSPDDETNNEDQSAAPVASDDHQVEITVDGEVQTVTVSALKRLYGQEASLTRKSQEVAAARKAADAEAERFVVSSQRLLDKAEERFAPFAKIDWMVAQNKLTPDEFSALREEARSAYQELSFLKAETDEVLSHIEQQRMTQLAEAAKETVATLERDIPGWNREVYDQVRTHAVDTGMDINVVNTIVDPAAIKLMHDAMRYRQLKAKAAQKKTSAPAAAKKVVRPSTKTSSMGSLDKASDARSKLAKSGNEDDAIAALLAGWERDPS